MSFHPLRLGPVGLFLLLCPLLTPGLGTIRAASAEEPPQADPDRVDFGRQIRPILSDRCFHCHGPDEADRKGGLRLDTQEGALAETPSGAHAVVPGDLDASELIWRITSDDDLDRMPPPDSGRSLSDEEIDLLRRWVAQGADWEQHWSFNPVGEVPIPDVGDPTWPSNPIDRFILARLDAEGLPPAPEADRERLIRRLSLDLTGLPPSVAEIDAFLADDRPDAYERLVDRLLDSPRFGEHLAVGWLDLARYADTYGYQADVERAVWPWRDWVIRSFNTNMPFDRFLTWQLAGDLIPPEQLDPDDGYDPILATAFNRLHRMTNEGGSIEEEFRAEYVADRTDTLGTAVLGLTIGCARCHDHKYDPISHRNYYELSSFFDNIDESGLYSHFTDATPTPTLLLTQGDQDRQIESLESQIQEAEAALALLADRRREAFDAWLDRPDREPIAAVTGLIGDFPLDEIASDSQTTPNLANPEAPARLVDAPQPIDGPVDGGLLLDGENSLVLPMGNFTRDDPFTVALWARTPDTKERAVLFHRSRAWTDAGSRGYQLLIEDGRLGASLVHFWPGNAIGIQAIDPMPPETWVHLAVTYDGSSRADGITLYVDGRPAAVEVVRDHLVKDITGGGGDELTFGQRFRDRGFIGGMIDEVKVADRLLTPLEVAHLHDGTALADAAASPEGERRDLLFAYYLEAHDPEYRAGLAGLRDLRRERSTLVESIPELMVMREMPEPRQTFLLDRGAYDAPRDPVESSTPESLLPFPTDQPRNRLGLARWLTDPQHPLTARVAVNRHWKDLFGRGLVATPEDFGSQGAAPTHPELLDWLARSFIDSGWDVKRLVRTIVTSSTYRQDSTVDPEIRDRDPENLLLARGPAQRLRGETIRDAALAASGLLVETIGGRPVKPYQPAGIWEENSGQAYVRDEGPGSHRRSLYTFWKRTAPPPSMITLDASAREVCTVSRPTTMTPLQALLLLNDPQYVEAARALAVRAMLEGGETLDARITFAFRSAIGRPPTDDESEILAGLYHEQVGEFDADRSRAEAFLAIGDQPPDPSLDPVEQAAFAVLVQVILNHDECHMKR
jgi:hypothetical protein